MPLLKITCAFFAVHLVAASLPVKRVLTLRDVDPTGRIVPKATGEDSNLEEPVRRTARHLPSLLSPISQQVPVLSDTADLATADVRRTLRQSTVANPADSEQVPVRNRGVLDTDGVVRRAPKAFTTTDAPLSSRNTVELVMVRYIELLGKISGQPFHWSDNFKGTKRIILNVGPSNLDLNETEKGTAPYEEVHVDNRGNEAYPYLHYIVTRYSTLPDMVIFAQAGAQQHSPQIEQLVQVPEQFQDVQPLAWAGHCGESPDGGCNFGGLGVDYYARCKDHFIFGHGTACKDGCKVWVHPMDLNMQGTRGSLRDSFWTSFLLRHNITEDSTGYLNEVAQTLELQIRFALPQWKSYGAIFAASRDRIRAVGLDDWTRLYNWLGNASDHRLIRTQWDGMYERRAVHEESIRKSLEHNRTKDKGFIMEYMWLALMGFGKSDVHSLASVSSNCEAKPSKADKVYEEIFVQHKRPLSY